jgi:hypothetical protein
MRIAIRLGRTFASCPLSSRLAALVIAGFVSSTVVIVKSSGIT